MALKIYNNCMKRKFTLFPCWIALVLWTAISMCTTLRAQTANQQRITQQCFSGPTQTFTQTSGTLLPAVTFSPGNGPGQIPVGHVVADVIVEIVWSKSDANSCTSPTGNVADLSHVGFLIRKQGSGTPQSLSYSGSSGGLVNQPATFTGTFPSNTNGILVDTIHFRDGAGLPNNYTPSSGDTIGSAQGSLSIYRGQPAAGVWSIGAIDDAPNTTSPALCIHSYCITLVTCDPSALTAVCQSFPEVALDPTTGSHQFNFADIDSLSDVSCLVNSITFSPRVVRCANTVAPVRVTMTIRDNLNNTVSCNSLVTVRDTSPPVIPYCSQPFGIPFDTLFVNHTGLDTFFASQIPMSDNCGSITKEIRPLNSGPWGTSLSFSCTSGGPLRQFWIRGIDAAGNVDSCRMVIRVEDTIPPNAVCTNTTIYVGNGPATLSPISIDGGSSDVCSPIVGRWIGAFNRPDPTYTCANVGVDTVTLVVRDVAGNLGTCNTAIVTVLDTTRPTAICQNATIYLNGAGNAMLAPGDIDGGSFDTCGIVARTVNGATSISYTCADAGTTQQVRLRVQDPSGNFSDCFAMVTVLDTVGPTAICQNATAYLNNNGTVSLSASTLNNNSIDACTGTNLSFLVAGSSMITFDCGDLGTNPVTLIVVDSNGAASTCSATVTVEDTLNPVANCATLTAYLNNNGLVTVTAAELSAGNTDNCSIVDSSVNVVGIPSVRYNCSSLFTPQTPTLIVRDATGNEGSCQATVNVVDTVLPRAICRGTYTAALNAVGIATVTPANIDSGSTDNCGITQYLINGAATQQYTCSDVGTLSAVLQVRDSSGGIGTCRTTINVVDNTLPTASCRISTAYLSASGTVAITPNNVLAFPGTGDNCGNITTTFGGGGTNIIYDCDSIDSRSVTVIVTDPSGNQASCQTTVNVRDTIDPTANCRLVPFTVQLDTSGNGFVTPQNIDNGSNDICGLDTLLVNGVDTFFFNCNNIGNTAVTLLVRDASGNNNFCSAPIMVVDNINPIARCKDTTLYIGASGVVTAFPSAIDNGSTDNCSFTRQINNLPSVTYDCNQVGRNTAQLQITDGNGNVNQCSADVTIIDSIPPVANCVAPNSVRIALDSNCFASVPAVLFNNNSTDNCSSTLTFTVNGLPNATFTNTNLSTNPNSITLRVQDGSGNFDECVTSVVVEDNIPPVMVCRPDTVQLDGNGNAVVIPNDINGGSRDNCSVPAYTINGGPLVNFTCANIGSNNVTLTGIDQSGNSDSCITTVFVEDITVPNAVCNSMVTVTLDPITNIGTLTPLQVNNGSRDNCTITNFSLSRTTFNCGDIPSNPYNVVLTVEDQSGNSNSCTTQVMVVDTIAPVAVCRATPLNLFLVGSTVSTTAAAINNGSFDNCGLATITLSQTNFNCNNIGSNTVTLTVTDSSSNTNSCTSTIIVSDTTDPVPFCVNPTVQLDANGRVGVAAVDLGIGSFDNCSIDTFLVNGHDSVFFSCSNLGANTVNVFMSDLSGNDATCTSTVTVEDNVPPVANCVSGPINLQLDPNGVATLTVAQVDNNSVDNCTVANRTLSRNTFNCGDVGNMVSVTLTVFDQSNNANSCVVNVITTDTVRPNMVCRAATINLGPSGTAPVSATLLDGGISDSCGIASLTFTGAPNIVTCADIGTLPITLTATDVNGNVGSCVTTLTVADTVAPVISCNTITLNLDNSGNAVVDSTTTGLYTATDACGIVALTLNGSNRVVYTCSDTGANNIQLIATDAAGNSDTCIAVVIIRDNTAPLVTCGNTIQFLQADGTLPVDPNWINAGIIETCGIDTIFTSPDTLDCSNVGTFNRVTLFVVDNSGNQSTCSGNIGVRDTTPPVVNCRDTALCLNGGFVNLTPADVDGGAVDACGLSPFQTINGASNVIFTCADLGVQTVTLQHEDVNGNVGTCQANVTVQDCTRPSAVCRTNFVAQIDANGLAVVNAIDLDFGSTDDCRIDSSGFRINGQDSLVYPCPLVNTTDTVLFTARDFAGNVDTCITIITIQDNIAPVARCGGPINGVLSATTGEFSIQASALDNSSNRSSDNCPNISYLINGQARDTFDCSMLGNNVVVLTVVDNYGNTDTCRTIVNIQDITAPTANCVFRTTQTLDSTGQALYPAANLISSSSDNCGIASITGNGLDTLLFDCADIGVNQIQVQVTDSSGNVFVCGSIVDVVDNTPPVAICPTNPVPVYLASNGTGWARASQLDSASFDNCGIASYLINGTDSVLYSCTQINTFPIATLTIVDSTGRSTTCPVTIEILDTIAPIARCSSAVVTLGPAGFAVVGPGIIDSVSSDNCGISTYLINNQALDTFDCSNVGNNNQVTLTVIDQYNNMSFCNATVSVVDNIPPTLQCPSTPPNFYLGNNGLVTITPQQVATAVDTCSIIRWLIDGQSAQTYNCSDVGAPTQALIQVEDPGGNAVQCNAIINILDTVAPVANCQNITVALDSVGIATVCGPDLAFGSTDNCVIIDTLVNGQNCITFTCADVTVPGNPQLVNVQLRDASNNTTTCVSEVQVIDNIAPVLVCNDTVPVQINASGVTAISPAQLISNVSDACTPITTSISQDTFNCANVGINTPVVVTAIDVNNNQSTCISIVQAEDNVAPVADCRNFTLYLNSGSGNATLLVDSIDNGSEDNCSVRSRLFANGSTTRIFSCADTGVVQVSMIVEDFSNNADTCTAFVTIRDTTPPSLTCRSTSIDLIQTGQRTLVPSDVLNSSMDNCGVDTIFLSPNVITCNDIGNVVYTLTAIDASGNIGTCHDTIAVSLDFPIITTPSQDTVLCEGADLPLSASVPANGFNYQYRWLGPNGIVTGNPATRDTVLTGLTAADEGNYIFSIQVGNGCTAFDTVNLIINNVPRPVLAGIPTCDGDQGAIYLSNDSVYVGNIVYNWYFNGTFISNATDTLFLPNMTAADSGTYGVSIQVTQGPAVCGDSLVVIGLNYDVLDLPAAPMPAANLPCEGQTLTLLNNAPGNTYTWTGPAGFNSTQPNPTRANAQVSFGGVYNLTITDANGCSNDSSVTVVISPTPGRPMVFYNEPLCAGDLLVLRDTGVYNFPPVFYYWERPSGVRDTTVVGQLPLINATSGIYQLTVSMNGCPSAVPDTAMVNFEPIPTATDDRGITPFRQALTGQNIISNDNPNAVGYNLMLVDSTIGGRLELNSATGTFDYFPRSGFFGVDTFRYSLCDAQCIGSCDTAEVLIEVLADFECYIPQGISPNGDGINDRLMIRCKNNYPNAVLQVFSRWGTLVYEGEPTGWAGQFNGKDLPDGTYFYILKLNDNTFTGTGTNRDEGRVGDRYTGYIMLQR